MTNYFKVLISYLVMDDNTGTSKKKSTQIIVDAVNYNDAEVTTAMIKDFFSLDELGGVTYDISRVRISNLIIDINNTHVSTSEEDIESLNKLTLVSENDGDINSSDDGFGIYKATFRYSNLDDKMMNENVHVMTDSMDEANNIVKLYMNKYHSGGAIIKIDKQKESSMLLSKDSVKNAKEIYTTLTGNS